MSELSEMVLQVFSLHSTLVYPAVWVGPMLNWSNPDQDFG